MRVLAFIKSPKSQVPCTEFKFARCSPTKSSYITLLFLYLKHCGLTLAPLTWTLSSSLCPLTSYQEPAPFSQAAAGNIYPTPGNSQPALAAECVATGSAASKPLRNNQTDKTLFNATQGTKHLTERFSTP